MTQPASENTSPLRIRCRYCKTEITLNEDSVKTRLEGQDPHQQMRAHIASCDATLHSYRSGWFGWFVDILAFSCPDDPARWREHAMKLFDAYMEQKL